MKEKNKVDIYRVNNLFDPVWLLHFSHFLHFCHIHLSKIVKMRERIIMTLTTFCCLIPSSKVDVIYCFYAKEFHFFELRKHNFRVFCFSFFLSFYENIIKTALYMHEFSIYRRRQWKRSKMKKEENNFSRAVQKSPKTCLVQSNVNYTSVRSIFFMN